MNPTPKPARTVVHAPASFAMKVGSTPGRLRRLAGTGAVVSVGVFVCANLALPATDRENSPPPIGILIASLQATYDMVHDFAADFEQRYSGGVLRTSVVERGTVHVKKPGKIRWSYAEPEEKLFISDGETLYSYIPEDRQVIVSKVPSDNRVSTPALFLAGEADLARDFTAAYTNVVDAPSDSWVVRLAPKRDNAGYDWLTLVVDPVNLKIRQLIAVDFQGGISTFIFSNLKENQALPDKLFIFEVPKDADVLTDGRFTR